MPPGPDNQLTGNIPTFHFIILHAKAKKHLLLHSALSRPTVRTRESIDGRLVVSASLDINLPSRRDACNLDVGS